MTLQAGTKLGSFEILAPIGAGGMGEVYLARDEKLDRKVAVKVLPELIARDAERVLRFEREAKLLASLSHPNIAVIHGFEESDGTHFLVMEYVEGETLAQRLKRGALPVDEALDLAGQIARALEAAHERGVIHRDLKPGNVMIGSGGSVKVLDFGLAKAMTDESSVAAEPDSPTITADYTKPGVLLGTAAYMSPEQARGRAVDRRTDIWSFGLILFECLTGETVFGGETASDSIGAVLHKDPDWSLLPAETPPTIRLLLRRCLAKDRNARLQSIGDARVELEDPDAANEVLAVGPEDRNAARPRASVLPWFLCGLLLVATILSVATRNNTTFQDATDRSVTKSVLTFPVNTGISWRGTRDTWGKIGFSRILALSNDGRRMLITLQVDGRTKLFLKEEDEFTPTNVSGAEGGRGVFLSPDGQWVGFLSERTLQKVRLPGGTPQPICEVESAAFDATWREDGTIIYSSDVGLRRVSDVGGAPERLTVVDVETGIRGHHFPQSIPGTPWVIFTLTDEAGQHAALLSLESGEWNIIKSHASDARYVASDHLVFARGGELFASPYDPSDPTTVGTEVPIARGVHTVPGQGGAVVYLFATSQTGKLAYVPAGDPPEPDALVWVDHQGNEELIVEDAGYWMHQRLSPQGDRILFNRLMSDGMLDIWIYEMMRGQTRRLTRSGNAYDAEWSPDGQTIGFGAMDTNGRGVYLIGTDFSPGSLRKIIAGSEARPHFSQWTDDGSTLVFFDRSSRGGIWLTKPEAGAEMRELINTDIHEGWARISPDGSLIAYVGWEGVDDVGSDGARRDVYVQAYPGLGPRVQVSRNGGGEPRWAHDSRILFFREAGKIYNATIVTDPNLDVSSVSPLPVDDVYDAARSGHQHYDLSVDSTRFLMVKPGRRVHPRRVHVIENWTASLDERAPS